MDSKAYNLYVFDTPFQCCNKRWHWNIFKNIITSSIVDITLTKAHLCHKGHWHLCEHTWVFFCQNTLRQTGKNVLKEGIRSLKYSIKN